MKIRILFDGVERRAFESNEIDEQFIPDKKSAVTKMLIALEQYIEEQKQTPA